MKDNRFLTISDYYEIITKEALSQIVGDNNDSKFKQAEESAEMSMLEYLTESYEIEMEIEKGKRISEYNHLINYPVGSYIEIDEKIYKITRAISGRKLPASIDYWEEVIVDSADEITMYSQRKTYHPEEIVYHNGSFYQCLVANGSDYSDVRIPGLNCWAKAECEEWVPLEYSLNSLVKYQGKYYMLISLDGYFEAWEPNECPENWGEIADYDETYNNYELSQHEYVVYNNEVFYPAINVNSDEVQIGKNVILEDPRHKNVKKHMVRIALYELCKNIAPNNVSVIREKDYESSIEWLVKASRAQLNPMIKRKIGENGKQSVSWGIATFQKSYDPLKNPWQI